MMWRCTEPKWWKLCQCPMCLFMVFKEKYRISQDFYFTLKSGNLWLKLLVVNTSRCWVLNSRSGIHTHTKCISWPLTPNTSRRLHWDLQSVWEQSFSFTSYYGLVEVAVFLAFSIENRAILWSLSDTPEPWRFIMKCVYTLWLNCESLL